jgi:hypothetical protein
MKFEKLLICEFKYIYILFLILNFFIYLNFVYQKGHCQMILPFIFMSPGKHSQDGVTCELCFGQIFECSLNWMWD